MKKKKKLLQKNSMDILQSCPSYQSYFQKYQDDNFQIKSCKLEGVNTLELKRHQLDQPVSLVLEINIPFRCVVT